MYTGDERCALSCGNAREDALTLSGNRYQQVIPPSDPGALRYERRGSGSRGDPRRVRLMALSTGDSRVYL